MKKNIRVTKNKLLAGIAVTSLVSATASAQTVNYGDLEMLFGEPVTTSATGKPQRVSEAPINMDIITAEDIRRSGSSDIPEILRRVAGVTVQRSNQSSADVGIRGYNGPFSERVLILVNGRQVYLDHFGNVDWSSIAVALEEIRQIEIVKGPNTALFGFNAVSGVINIVTFDPLDDDISAATVRYGTSDFREVSATATLKLGDRLGVRISAGGYDADEFAGVGLSPSELFFAQDTTERRFVGVNAAYQVTDNVRANFEYTRGESKLNRFVVLYSVVRSEYTVESFKGNIAAETSMGLTDITVYRNTLDNLDVVAVGDFPFDQQVTDIKINHLFKLNSNHAFRITAGYRDNEWLIQPVLPSPSFAYQIYTIGGLWDWTINDNAAFSLAARLDNVNPGLSGDFSNSNAVASDFEGSFSEVSINAGFVYKVSSNDTLRLTYARGVDLPSLMERSISSRLRNGALLIGDPNVTSSIVNNYEIGYDHQFSDNLKLRLSGYYQEISNLQSFPDLFAPVFQDGDVLLPFLNAGDSRVYGFEADLKGTVGDHFTWNINYSYSDVDDNLTVNKMALSTPAGFEDNNPSHVLNGNIQYTLDRLEVDLNGSLTSARDQLRFFPDGDPMVPFGFISLPTRFVLNARIGYKLTDALSIAFEGQGLTQNHYAETSLAEIDRRVRVSLQATF